MVGGRERERNPIYASNCVVCRPPARRWPSPQPDGAPGGRRRDSCWWWPASVPLAPSSRVYRRFTPYLTKVFIEPTLPIRCWLSQCLLLPVACPESCHVDRSALWYSARSDTLASDVACARLGRQWLHGRTHPVYLMGCVFFFNNKKTTKEKNRRTRTAAAWTGHAEDEPTPWLNV